MYTFFTQVKKSISHLSYQQQDIIFNNLINNNTEFSKEVLYQILLKVHEDNEQICKKCKCYIIYREPHCLVCGSSPHS
jgi:hypothetical protein